MTDHADTARADPPARREPPTPDGGDATDAQAPAPDATTHAVPARRPAPALPAILLAAVEQAAHYAASARAQATLRAYKADWADWAASWCAGTGLAPLPALPAAVGAYLAARADHLSVATLTRRLSAISVAHRDAGHHLDTRHPAIRQVMQGIRRTHGTAPRRARAATTALLRTLLATCDDSLIGVRDRALLLLGFASALRRSELVALTLADVAFSGDGVTLHIRRSKTDQEAVGDAIGVMTTGSASCPVAALQAWLMRAGVTQGHVFRSMDRHGHLRASMTGEAVALVVQKRARMAGLDPAGFSAHSLRAGLATSAAAAGLEERHIQRQTRHRSTMVLRGYIREGSVFRQNVSGHVGL